MSGDNKIMGTIGVVNLSTTNEAHYAGKVVGQNDFIAPLTSAKGVASKLGNGTGVVEAEFKGHYLILTWSEFVNGTDPTTTARTEPARAVQQRPGGGDGEHRPQPAHGHRRARPERHATASASSTSRVVKATASSAQRGHAPGPDGSARPAASCSGSG